MCSVAVLIEKGTVQQKSTVTLTLIHAARTPPCIDLTLNCTHNTALNAHTELMERCLFSTVFTTHKYSITVHTMQAIYSLAYLINN